MYRNWLLNFEFYDTMFILTKAKAVFVVSSKKSKSDCPHWFPEALLDEMREPEGYNGPKLVTILKEARTDGSEAISQAFEGVDLGTKVGVYTKDKPDGDFTAKALEKLAALEGATLVEAKELVDDTFRVKIA